MDENAFAKRLSELRIQKGISARDMSLSINQNPAYINNIENGKALPSMSSFFEICKFLEISEVEFFDIDNKNPLTINSIHPLLKQLDEKQSHDILNIVKDILAIR